MRNKSARWSPGDLAAHLSKSVPAPAAQPKPAKYRNKKVTVDGVTFDSAGEQKRYAELLKLEQGGHISHLTLGMYFVLAPACDIGEARKKPALRYKADFCYCEDDGTVVVEDFKSAITKKHPVYRIKKHLMATVHGIIIRESRK